MSEDIIYRIARENDLNALVGFLSSPEIDQSFVRPLSQRQTTIAERAKQKYENGLWLIALANHNIAGCLALVLNRDNIEISTYAVGPNYQGRGIGGRLIDEAVKISQERYGDRYRTIILDSWEGNSAIERLMQKKGFVLSNAFEDPAKRPEGVKTVVYSKDI